MRTAAKTRAPLELAALALCLVLGACGDDEAVTSPPPTAPPAPVVAELPPRPFLGSAEPFAQVAEDTVVALLAAIDTPAAMHAALAPVATSTWTARGACLVASDPAGGPEYQACPAAGGWTWAVVAEPDRQLFAGETDATGRVGDFLALEPPDADLRWTWQATASRDSVEWAYDRGGRHVDLHWSRDQEGARLWLWTWPGERRIGYRTAAALATGWCESHDWSAGGWVLRQEIAWDAGHGRWLRFDAAGHETQRMIW